MPEPIERNIVHAGAEPDESRSPRAMWLAIVAGVVFAALSLAPGFIGGRGAFWQTPAGDAAAGEIGWFYYARDDWRFPLFAIGNYHEPEGSNVLLTDSVPLLALPMKALYRAFWPPEELPPIYMGAWVALCFVLQAIAAARLLGALGVRGWVANLAGIALFCYLPMLFLRFGHMSLLAQCFVIAALEGYVRAKRGTLGRRHARVLIALPVLALLVQPYLAAMAGAIVVAATIDQWRERTIGVRDVAIRLGAMLAAALVVMALGGFFVAATTTFDDYGRYSMNLLSPFVPFASTLSGRLLGSDTPSIPGLGQWEGGVYLGAGMMLLSATAAFMIRGAGRFARRHAVLIGVLVLLVLFAVSNRVGFGAREILHVPLPDRLMALLSTFRGSGRFAWVAVYALAAGAIAIVVRRCRGRTAAALLACCAIVQIADVAPMQGNVRAASALATPARIDRPAWERLVSGHERIFEFPSFECGSAFANGEPGSRWRELGVNWIAARLGKPTNSAYLTRPFKDCERERRDAASGHDRPGTLYLYRSSEDIGAFLLAAGADLDRCGLLDDVVVCSASMNLSGLR